MNNKTNELMLLPQTRCLRLRQIEGVDDDFFIVDLPQWFADYTGKPKTYYIGKSLKKTLEPLMSGVLELALHSLNNHTPLADYKAFLTDKEGNKHSFALEAVKEPFSYNQKEINIYTQELPSTGLVNKSQTGFMDLIGTSQPMQQVFNKIRMYAVSTAPVLITGETGAGKEGVASAIHKLSERSSKPFVTMNCSAITETLFESELFGHEKGSFTGALASHRGRFERANGGVLFLDEIGDLPLLSQAKLLRALETSVIERVGGEKSFKIDVRVIAATNANLEEASQNSRFRADLLYRINALQIHLPPLRERKEDIELLINHFIDMMNQRYNRNIVCLTKDALHLLKQYQWPGNIRELRNLMERLFAENQAQIIGLRALKEWYEERVAAAKYATSPSDYNKVTVLPHREVIPLGLPQKRNSIEIDDLKRAFHESNHNITQASKALGIHKATFYRMLKNNNMTRADLE